MDESLRQALKPVLRDLQSTGVAAPRIEDVGWTDDPDRPSVMLWSADGSGTGVFVSRSQSLPERAAAMADKVQEWAIEEVWGRAPTNWPPCPRHPDSHPMKATTQGGVPAWVCPADDTFVATVGTV